MNPVTRIYTVLVLLFIPVLLVSACSQPQQSVVVPPSEMIASAVSFDDQRRVTELVQLGITYYWQGGDYKKIEKEFFRGITLKGDFNVVEASFVEASALAPQRLDLRFSVASSQVIQGKLDDALATYQRILELDPENFDAQVLYAAYSRVNNDPDSFNATMQSLSQTHPVEAANYEATFSRVENIFKMPINVEARKVSVPNHTIVILGYALDDNGMMRAPLIGRLEQGVAMYRMNPDANIIVTGGVPKQGVTESYLMKRYLVERGIPASKVFIEDKAKDTVGNAVFSSRIMAEQGTKSVTLISSASHVRRGVSVFKEASIKQGLDIQFDNLAYLDYDTVADAEVISPKEYMVVYRDALRGSGLWNYPGIQQ